MAGKTIEQFCIQRANDSNGENNPEIVQCVHCI